MQLKLNKEDKNKLDKMLAKINRKFPSVLIEALNQSMCEIGIRAAGKYLQGPGPKHLNILTGRLLRSMMGSYSFHSEPGAYGTNYGIHTIRVVGNKIIGTKGTEAKAPGGYDYPARWEYGGTVTILPIKTKALHFKIGGKDVFAKSVTQKGPRPFFSPAVRDIQPKIPGIFNRRIKTFIDEMEK